ncbi:hypothetical protein AKJ36_01790 [candidate division MSBL1 archaeon SCGC-AAA259I07]|uniref:Uncharacterized protein n=1 Tax=candidate division MSBL1 archaeon SCGC-AAA259I07 TaxID=1698266 RepID=A0A133ULJ4_9EURY|nr:hypothetical protein AKJ36_01790 [candidate division MSBL1 archaeon SCGC-AAA259I07]
MIPDISKLFPSFEYLHDSIWADAFFFHHTWDNVPDYAFIYPAVNIGIAIGLSLILLHKEQYRRAKSDLFKVIGAKKLALALLSSAFVFMLVSTRILTFTLGIWEAALLGCVIFIGFLLYDFPDNPKRSETVTILVNSSEIPQIGEDRVITFKATGLKNRMWEISENQPQLRKRWASART